MRTTKVYRNGYEFQICLERPFFRFKGGKRIKGGPVTPAPVPTPVAVDEDVEARDRDRRRQRVMAAGRQGTILTENTGTDSSKASLLGRSSS